MYTPFERQGSIELATHAKLDRVIIEEKDVTIQFLEGNMVDESFHSLGADHISMTPEAFGEYEDVKAALIGELAKR